MSLDCQEHAVCRFAPGKEAKKRRKVGINRNKEGSIRPINGKVYADFVYLGDRVREPWGTRWTEENARKARRELDRIMVNIGTRTFRFHEAFPLSRKREFFRRAERVAYGLRETPDMVSFGPEASDWLRLHEAAHTASGRTLFGYRSHLTHYLIPFFGTMRFGDLNRVVFKEFVAFARGLRLKGKPVANETINKLFVPLKMISDHAAAKYGWGASFHPFSGWHKLPEADPIEKIFPFSLPEQKCLRECLPAHYRPYFDFAFRSGLRPGEQIALKAEDIDWERGLLHVRRAITMDGRGKRIDGQTKNAYSRRTIRLTEFMGEALREQREVHDRCGGDYFFSTPDGRPLYLSSLSARVWVQALERAGLARREMKQTRHSFATNALSFGENPLWIAKVMGHRDAEMVVKVYARFVENARGTADGEHMARAYLAVLGAKRG